MNPTFLPAHTNPNSPINKAPCGTTGTMGTATGLSKSDNEDRLGYLQEGATMRICIADGHWGDWAADAAIKQWLRPDVTFPASRAEAIKETTRFENAVYKQFGNDHMDESHDFTPETSFIVAEIRGNMLTIISYGDCRLLVAAQGKVRFELETKETWLGAFSRTGLRNRLSVASGLVYEQLTLDAGDQIFLFSDGVDQCVYEKPTISNNELLALASGKDSSRAFDDILSQVFAHGAEDNASLAILQI